MVSFQVVTATAVASATEWTGVVQVMVSWLALGVWLLMDTLAQGCPAMVTAEVMLSLLVVKPVPTMVMLVPPAVVPVFGVMVEIVGEGRTEILARAVYARV